MRFSLIKNNLLNRIVGISVLFFLIILLKYYVLTKPYNELRQNSIIDLSNTSEIVAERFSIGEMGKPVLINRTTLPESEKAKFDLEWRINGFNNYASKMISINRKLPDVRDKECLNYTYSKNLPQTSIIICFNNEPWEALLRSVHSIISRTPAHLLKEIILVDDFSTMEHLKTPLDEYMSKLKLVKIIRTIKREGLIRARLFGAKSASAEILTFLDSHIECTEGWLEPLLDPITQSWSNVTVPHIDQISVHTMEYQNVSAKHVSVGGFYWDLMFLWTYIPARDNIGRSPTDPVNTSVMAGGLFSISKKYFEHLGGYDPDFQIYGGENLELSFKIWMCGGILKIVPCSHVGHISKLGAPYSIGKFSPSLKRNLVRLSEVWLDEYKEFYYMRFNYSLGEYGDVSDRISLRKSLKCKNFKWYIENIYPEMYVPQDVIYNGIIKNLGTAKCLNGPVRRTKDIKYVIAYPCHNQGGNQYWTMTKKGEIRRDLNCLQYQPNTISINYCHGQYGNQHWNYTEIKTIRQVVHNICLESNEKDNELLLVPCSDTNHQKWILQKADFRYFNSKSSIST